MDLNRALLQALEERGQLGVAAPMPRFHEIGATFVNEHSDSTILASKSSTLVGLLDDWVAAEVDLWICRQRRLEQVDEWLLDPSHNWSHNMGSLIGVADVQLDLAERAPAEWLRRV